MPTVVDGVPHSGNFVLKVRRPNDPGSPAYAIRDHKGRRFLNPLHRVRLLAMKGWPIRIVHTSSLMLVLVVRT